jgi:hypothetical protein
VLDIGAGGGTVLNAGHGVDGTPRMPGKPRAEDRSHILLIDRARTIRWLRPRHSGLGYADDTITPRDAGRRA